MRYRLTLAALPDGDPEEVHSVEFDSGDGNRDWLSGALDAFASTFDDS